MLITKHVAESGSAPSTPSKFNKFVKPSKDTVAVQKAGTTIHRHRPAAIDNLIQGVGRHVASANMDSEFPSADILTYIDLIITNSSCLGCNAILLKGYSQASL